MSGRTYEKNIKAISENVKRVSKEVIPPPIFRKTELSTSIRKWLWRLNNIMFIFHTAFCIVTMVMGKLELTTSIYKIALSSNMIGQTPNSSVPSVDFSSFSVADAPPGWDALLGAFLSVSTELQSFELPITWLVAIFFFLSAFFHFGNANIWWKSYIYYLEREECPSRWIEYTLSASTMILIISYSAGILVDVELFMIFILVATTMFFGHLTETVNTKSVSEDKWTLPLRQRITPHLMGYVPQLSAWFVILYIFMDNSDGAPEFVTAIIWGQLALFFSFGFVQLAVILRKPSKYVQGEIAYQILSLVSKGLLGVIMMVNVIFLAKWPCVIPELKEIVPYDYC